ncbi:oleate hydratase [Caloranaerobacter sp. DY30410]|uniref:oleate hydratase n=1 Tax=Caloranaerobacter sp. DY30410 TaxID=3238305 RepID=UPI003D0156E7
MLDEIHEINAWGPNVSVCRIIEKQGQKLDFTTLGLNKKHIKQLVKLSLATEEELRNITVEQFFDPKNKGTVFLYPLLLPFHKFIFNKSNSLIHYSSEYC